MNGNCRSRRLSFPLFENRGTTLATPLQIFVMTNREKLAVMDKVLRELEDLTNSQTSVLKKIGQIEAENINLGDKYLDEKLPAIFEHADDAQKEATEIQSGFAEVREKFYRDNNLEQPEPEA